MTMLAPPILEAFNIPIHPPMSVLRRGPALTSIAYTLEPLRLSDAFHELTIGTVVKAGVVPTVKRAAKPAGRFRLGFREVEAEVVGQSEALRLRYTVAGVRRIVTLPLVRTARTVVSPMVFACPKCRERANALYTPAHGVDFKCCRCNEEDREVARLLWDGWVYGISEARILERPARERTLSLAA